MSGKNNKKLRQFVNINRKFKYDVVKKIFSRASKNEKIIYNKEIDQTVELGIPSK
jgi:hypothetical protein